MYLSDLCQSLLFFSLQLCNLQGIYSEIQQWVIQQAECELVQTVAGDAKADIYQIMLILYNTRSMILFEEWFRNDAKDAPSEIINLNNQYSEHH